MSMNAMRTILLPINFSNQSRIALDCALSYFSPEEYDYVILHAIDHQAPNGILVSVDDIVEQKMKKQLKTEWDELFQAMGKNSPVVKIEAKRGPLIEIMASAIESHRVDVIVISAEQALGDSPKKAARLEQVKSFMKPILFVPC